LQEAAGRGGRERVYPGGARPGRRRQHVRVRRRDPVPRRQRGEVRRDPALVERSPSRRTAARPGERQVQRVLRSVRVPAAVTEAVREFVRRDLRAAAVPWALARVLVVGSLALWRFAVDHLEHAVRPVQLGQGLFAWDAAFYREIAEHGYGAARSETLRFFPLVPLASRWLGVVFLGNDAAALIVVANGSALLFGAL